MRRWSARYSGRTLKGLGSRAAFEMSLLSARITGTEMLPREASASNGLRVSTLLAQRCIVRWVGARDPRCDRAAHERRETRRKTQRAR
jgi:hypothetical protein